MTYSINSLPKNGKITFDGKANFITSMILEHHKETSNSETKETPLSDKDYSDWTAWTSKCFISYLRGFKNKLYVMYGGDLGNEVELFKVRQKRLKDGRLEFKRNIVYKGEYGEDIIGFCKNIVESPENFGMKDSYETFDPNTIEYKLDFEYLSNYLDKTKIIVKPKQSESTNKQKTKEKKVLHVGDDLGLDLDIFPGDFITDSDSLFD